VRVFVVRRKLSGTPGSLLIIGIWHLQILIEHRVTLLRSKKLSTTYLGS